MRQVIVELDDSEMAQIEALARAHAVLPAEVLKTEALNAGTKNPTSTETSDDEHGRELRRKARLAILMRSNGILVVGDSNPKDGLVYESALRSEWQ
jgi:hypothetical protein